MKQAPLEIGPLLNELRSTDWKVRSNAAQMLGGSRHPDAVLPLIEALASDSSWTVRTRAATALGRLKDERAIEPLVAAFKAGNWQLLRHAFKCVIKFGDKAVPHLAFGANAPNETTSFRGTCVDALGAIGTEAAQQALLPFLGTPDVMVRLQAIAALGELRSEAVFQALLHSLANIPPWENLESSLQWGAKPAIQQALVRALNRWNDERVVAPFVALLEGKQAFSPDTEVLTAITNGLRQLSGVCGKMHHELVRELEGATPTARTAVGLSLVWLRDRRGLETLSLLREDEDALVQVASQWAYGQLEEILGYGVPTFPLMVEFMLR